MEDQTQVPNVDVDQEELQDNARFFELNKKEDRTEEEDSEMKELKDRYGKRVQKKMAEFTYQVKERDERLAKQEEEMASLRQQMDEIKTSSQQRQEPIISQSVVKIGSKEFYTDEALRMMIDSGKTTEAEAIKHQQQRLVAEAEEGAYKRLKSEQEQQTKQRQVMQEAEQMYKKYPHWKQGHPSYNPRDPLYIEANKWFAKGLSPLEAMELAEKLHGKTNARVDLSDQLSVNGPSINNDKVVKDKEITLTDDEKELAERMYCLKNLTNPKTGRPYTEKEAHEKYKRAKASRIK